MSTIKEVLDKDAVLGAEHLKVKVKASKEANHLCDGCALGKSHRTAFKPYSLKPIADDICNRIYCDLSGPVKVHDLDHTMLTVYKSLGSPLYLSAIVDEKSRYVTGKLLKVKSEAAAHIMNWIKVAENLQEKPVKYFHSDGGGEYVNGALSQFFASKGIKVETTCADTPQHNAVVERANKIVFEMARSMLQHAGMPVVFWGEAVLTACYLMNFRLCVNDKSKTAVEVWSGHKPHVQHLRVFGCDAYVHVAKHNRTKMDAKAVKGIFIGYDKVKENGYRVYDITKYQVLVSRDVRFYETSFTAVSELVSGQSSAVDDIRASDLYIDKSGVSRPSSAISNMPEPEMSRDDDQDSQLDAEFELKHNGDGDNSVSPSIVPNRLAVVPIIPTSSLSFTKS